MKIPEIIRIMIIAYILLINIVSFSAMRKDKRAAERGRQRTPEKTLFLLAVLGGSLGSMAGMKVFHHKTKHRSFTIGMPFIFALQLAAAACLIFNLLQR